MGSIVFVVCGSIALVVAAWQGVQAKYFLGRSVRTVGHVVLAPGQTGTMASAHPTIEFATIDGSHVRYRQNGMSGRRVGTPITILYDPSAPAATATVSNFWTLWFPVLAPLALGLAFLAVPLLGVAIGLSGARP